MSPWLPKPADLNRLICTSGKVTYMTRREVLAAARRHRQRPYRCERCRFWHLTTRWKRRRAGSAS